MESASAHRSSSARSPARPHPAQAERAPGQRAVEAAIRVLDLLTSCLLLVALAPLFAALAVAIRADSGGPALFRQRRCGREFDEFTVFKFRTMRCDTAEDPHRSYVLDVINGDGDDGAKRDDGLQKLEHDDRITWVGAFLRRFSLDELPQLWNVVRGEMSLVGPRPPIPYEVEFYPPHWMRRLSVKPGMTGLWQVSGRNELDYRQMVELDLEYVERRSLWLNLEILTRTIKVVLSGRGAV